MLDNEQTYSVLNALSIILEKTGNIKELSFHFGAHYE